MKQMEECAKIAAKHKLCVLFHGCTLPGGENRTYPNILSYEAVFGEEYHKFGLGSPTIDTLLPYPYTRNVVGSMDFTPAALPAVSIPATAAFQLAESIVFESGTVNLASSIYAYEGNAALGFLNQVESSFEKSLLLDEEQAAPGKYVAMARKSKTSDKWMLGVMTKKATQTKLSLDFLGEGTYQAVLFEDNDRGTAVGYKTMQVTKDTVISETLKDNGGLAMIVSKDAITMPQEKYDYYGRKWRDLVRGCVCWSQLLCLGFKAGQCSIWQREWSQTYRYSEKRRCLPNEYLLQSRDEKSGSL